MPGTLSTVWPQVGYAVGTGSVGKGGITGLEDAVVDAFVEVANSIAVEVVVVFETDSDGDEVDVATTGEEEEVEVLNEEGCAKSLDVEEDAVLEVDADVVDEPVTSGDVEVGTGDDDNAVESDEEDADDDD